MSKRVLIVDDSEFMRMQIRETLTKEGYEVIAEAENGEDAIEKYKKFRPDLVTMDIIMIGEGGLKSVTDIVSFDEDAKILMISAMGQQSLMVKAINAGAKGFVIKPFKKEHLIDEVKRVAF